VNASTSPAASPASSARPRWIGAPTGRNGSTKPTVRSTRIGPVHFTVFDQGFKTHFLGLYLRIADVGLGGTYFFSIHIRTVHAELLDFVERLIQLIAGLLQLLQASGVGLHADTGALTNVDQGKRRLA
jgi:hypothetical protein